jgi:hypothetical protein
MKGESPEEFLASAGIREAPPPDGHEGKARRGKKAVSPAEPKACSHINLAAEDRDAIAMLAKARSHSSLSAPRPIPAFLSNLTRSARSAESPGRTSSGCASEGVRNTKSL